MVTSGWVATVGCDIAPNLDINSLGLCWAGLAKRLFPNASGYGALRVCFAAMMGERDKGLACLCASVRYEYGASIG